VKATQLLLAVLAEFALKPIDVQIILKTPLEGRGYFFNRPVIKTHFGRYCFNEIRGTTLILGRAIASAEVRSDEEIKFVIFCIDNNFITWDSSPPYEWKIQGKHYPPVGRHKLKVYVYTVSDKVATDEMDIIMLTLSYQYGRF
jgi:hypothetical protein